MRKKKITENYFLAILYPEEEESTCFNASRDSPWSNAFFCMDGSKIRTGRS